MEIDEFYAWSFIQKESLKEGCEIKCAECGEWSSHKDWEEGSVYCDRCGDHASIDCPSCGEQFDHVWAKPFEVRTTLTHNN